jgi:hypothetical protein
MHTVARQHGPLPSKWLFVAMVAVRKFSVVRTMIMLVRMVMPVVVPMRVAMFMPVVPELGLVE